jgi:hypothetical protein
MFDSIIGIPIFLFEYTPSALIRVYDNRGVDNYKDAKHNLQASILGHP